MGRPTVIKWSTPYGGGRKNGSPVPSLTELSFPPEHPYVIIPFIYIKLFKNERFLREKYVDEGLSIREIASLCFSARSTIAENLKGFAIELRPQDDAMNTGQVAYGRKRLKRNDVEHKRELETLAKIQELRRQGFSYHKIAAILNAMEVPTKNRKKWHGTTVMNILKSS